MTERRATPLSLRLCLCLAAATTVIAACDTGDGTRLEPPTRPTTLPPPDTTPLPSLPLDGSSGGAPIDDAVFNTLASVATVPFDSSAEPSAPLDGSLQVFAPWAEGGPVDAVHTCVGNNASPAVSWAGVPEGTVELAISLVDESELRNGEPFVHWAITGLDPALGRLDEATVPPGSVQALNFFGDVGYGGPCPNPGETHNYRLTLYALGQQAEVADGTPATEFLDGIEAIAFDTASTLSTATR